MMHESWAADVTRNDVRKYFFVTFQIISKYSTLRAGRGGGSEPAASDIGKLPFWRSRRALDVL